jgi:hypothetical protein
MKPCVVCRKTPTRMIKYRKIDVKTWTNVNYCVKHDPFEDDYYTKDDEEFEDDDDNDD